MEDRTEGEPTPPNRPSRRLRLNVPTWFLLLFSAMLLLLYFTSGVRNRSEVSYNFFREQLQAGNVAEVEFIGQTVHGKFNEPPDNPDPQAKKDKEGKQHVTPDATYAGEFVKYYAYNIKDIAQNEADWVKYIDAVIAAIDKVGKASVVIEASASKVPTKTFGTNENLSRQRMEDARKRLIEAIQARGKNPDMVFIEAINNKVQGPKYLGDFQNTEKYGKFQYVKLKVR